MPATPLQRLTRLAFEDKRDLTILVVYTVFTGILSLVIPLGSQALVNTIAAGMFLQPLAVLTFLVLLGLLFSGLLKVLQLILVETIQQRLFAKIALRLAYHVPRIKQGALKEEYAPELVNRFFDTIIIQKAWAKLLLDVPSSVLQIVAGLALMAVYSPYLFAFEIFLLLAVFGIGLLGAGGLKTSIQESTEKYRVAHWLEELGRCHVSFKMNGLPDFLNKRLDENVVEYVNSRRKHFIVILRQVSGSYLLQAIANVGILAIGGWLVINQQLSLGQLVAAELVILIVLSAMEKLINRVDVFYDLLTSLEKIGHIIDMPIERTDGVQFERLGNGAEIECQNVSFAYTDATQVLSDFNLNIASGEKVSLIGRSGAGKTTVAYLLCGLHEPKSGRIVINNADVRDLELNNFRKNVALVSNSNEIFEGTIEDNIRLGRTHISHKDLHWAIDLVDLNEDLSRLPEGLQTRLVSEGQNLSLGQRLRILIARAILERPELLVLDEAFIGTDERTKLKIIAKLFDPELPWTIFNISHDAEVVIQADKIFVLKDGKVVESGKARELAKDKESAFSNIFPELTRQIKAKAV